jgi:hypothetical protein
MSFVRGTNLAGSFVLVDIAASVDPPGAESELIGIGLTEGPFDGLGHLIGVGNSQEGKRTVLGLVDQVGMGQEQLAEQLATFGGCEPVEGRGGGSTAALVHVDGQLQSDGRRARNGGRPIQVL